MKLLLSAKEVAEALSVSRATVYRLVARGVLPRPLQLGGSSRWRVEDVVAVTRGGA